MAVLRLLAIIVLTWSTANPALQVRIERRRADAGVFTHIATVPGTQYRDTGLRRHTTFCYQARYVTGTQYTPQACATTR